MSGALPITEFRAVNFRSNQKTLFSETDSGKTFRRQVQGQRFSFTVSYPPMKRTEFAPIMAFIMKQRARKEYYNELRKAKARLSSFTKEDALQVIRKNFKQSPKL